MKLITLSLLVMMITNVSLFSEQLFDTTQKIVRLSAFEFNSRLKNAKENGENLVLLDIRTNPEFIQGHLSDAIMIDFYSPGFIENLKKLDRSKTYLIYCRTGNRTGQTLQVMQKLDFKEVYDLKNGIKSWINAGYTIEK